jgi:hypothetical protein
LAGEKTCITIFSDKASEVQNWFQSMGSRRESRHAVRLPVRIFGTDAEGQVFSENVYSFDISKKGARLDGVRTRLKMGEVIGLVHGKNKSRFCVKWAGLPNTPQAGQLGLVSVVPEKSVWDAPIPAAGVSDSYEPPHGQAAPHQAQGGDRRQPPRLKCTASVQITVAGQSAPIWGKAEDLSTGGCFVEMSMPLQKGSKVKIAIWIKENKLWATGRVVSSRPGFGNGIQFIEISESDAEELRQFLQSITQLPMHP